MKTLKRILAVLLLIITVLAVSYFVYTAKNLPVTEAIHETAKSL